MARLWLEKGPRSGFSWRGRVKHVQGDREEYFGTLKELGRFLEEISGVATPDDDTVEPPPKDSAGEVKS